MRDCVKWVDPWSNNEISPDLLQRATVNVTKLQNIIATRQQFLNTGTRENLEFVMNGGNWNIDGSAGHIYLSQLMLRHGPEGLSRLRWFTHCLSGYSSLLLQGGPGSPHVHYGSQPGNYLLRHPLWNNEERPVTRELVKTIVESRQESELRWVDRWMILQRRVPETLRMTFPPIAGEAGFECDGYSVLNFEAFYVLRILVLLFEGNIISCLDKAAAQSGRAKIIEIGSGFGALIYGLQRHLKQAKFYLVDIPESLLFSAGYLPIVCPDRTCVVIENPQDIEQTASADFICIPNTIFRDCLGRIGSIDLAINTFSFNEMGPHQVDAYAKAISTLIADHGIFFEMNHKVAHCNHSDADRILPKHFKHRTGTQCDHLFFEAYESAVPNVWSNLRLGELRARSRQTDHG